MFKALILLVGLMLPLGSSYGYALINLDTGYGAGTGVNVDAKAEILGEGQVMSVTQAQVSANINDEEVIDVAPKAVLTNADLQAYAAGAVRSDTRIDEMNFTNETVEVKYEEEGRLLALIPVTFTVSVVAKADGTVEVEYPWYSVITVDKRDRIEVQAKVAVDNALRARLVGSVRAEGIEAEPRFTADESAEVAAQIHAVLKAGLTGDNTVD